MKMKYLAAIIPVCLLFFPTGKAGPSQDGPIRATMIELIAVPERFSDKLVTVTGFMTVGERPDTTHGGPPGLYLHQEDYLHNLGNAFWVKPTEQMHRDRERLNLMYVKCTGLFTSLGRPSERSYDTRYALTEVQRCTPWSNPNRPIALQGDKSKFK
jgi:hypothetical protein